MPSHESKSKSRSRKVLRRRSSVCRKKSTQRARTSRRAVVTRSYRRKSRSPRRLYGSVDKLPFDTDPEIRGRKGVEEFKRRVNNLTPEKAKQLQAQLKELEEKESARIQESKKILTSYKPRNRHHTFRVGIKQDSGKWQYHILNESHTLQGMRALKKNAGCIRQTKYGPRSLGNCNLIKELSVKQQTRGAPSSEDVVFIWSGTTAPDVGQITEHFEIFFPGAGKTIQEVTDVRNKLGWRYLFRIEVPHNVLMDNILDTTLSNPDQDELEE